MNKGKFSLFDMNSTTLIKKYRIYIRNKKKILKYNNLYITIIHPDMNPHT